MAKRPKYVVEFKAPNWKSVGIFAANMLKAMELISAEEHRRLKAELDRQYGEDIEPAAPGVAR